MLRRDFRPVLPAADAAGEHRAEIPSDQLLQGGGVGLACPETRQLCCYIGDIYQVQRALRNLEISVQKKNDQEDTAFVDDIIMYEVLSELKDIAARGGISCACGAKGCSIEVHGSAVDLVCPACGGRLRLPAATDEDLDRLCCQYTLTIPGKK